MRLLPAMRPPEIERRQFAENTSAAPCRLHDRNAIPKAAETRIHGPTARNFESWFLGLRKWLATRNSRRQTERPPRGGCLLRLLAISNRFERVFWSVCWALNAFPRSIPSGVAA